MKQRYLARFMCLLICAVMIVCAGCNQDEQTRSDLETLMSTAKGVVDKATNGSDRAAALAAATEFLESKTAALAESAERIKSLKDFQLSDDVLARVKTEMKEAGATITSLRVVLEKEIVADPKVDAAVENLIEIYKKAVLGK